MQQSDIGLIGLAVMGENLVMNMESKGFTVSVFNRTTEKVKAVKPMIDCVIADFELTEIMLNYFINKIKARSLFSRPRILF